MQVLFRGLVDQRNAGGQHLLSYPVVHVVQCDVDQEVRHARADVVREVHGRFGEHQRNAETWNVVVLDPSGQRTAKLVHRRY